MKIREVFVLTGEVIDRDMTPDELAQRKLDDDKYKAEQEKIKETATAKSALLDKLGITAEEAALLLS